MTGHAGSRTATAHPAAPLLLFPDNNKALLTGRFIITVRSAASGSISLRTALAGIRPPARLLDVRPKAQQHFSYGNALRKKSRPCFQSLPFAVRYTR
jgi:hypothetical protein